MGAAQHAQDESMPAVAVPLVTEFFDPATFTYSYVVVDPATDRAAIIDPVLDYDAASGRTSTGSADRIVSHVRERGLTVDWILETHVHADHLSGGSYVKAAVGGQTGIGTRVSEVQRTFGALFNAEPGFACDGSQFDRCLDDEDTLAIGDLTIRVLSTPGHTPACVTYLIGDAAFVGDTLFMPDYGTARTDFPGGDAHVLYRSIRRILELPAGTRLYMCHDYGSADRSEFQCLTSVADQRAGNVHVHDGIDEAEFAAAREVRDAGLAAPRLLLPAVQFNMRGAALPPAEDNGTHYFKIPVRSA